MVKVLTIRDPKTGALIAEERVQPNEDTKAAVARVYRKTLGPEAPEFMVTTKSIWLNDRDWAAELRRDWGDFGLALLGPKGDARLEQTRLVLWRVSEAQPLRELPISRDELDKIKNGQRCTATIPEKPGNPPPAVGDKVTFLEAAWDPFGGSILVPKGETVSVELTRVEKQGGQWFGQDLYSIVWDPPPTEKRLKQSEKQGST